MYQFWAQLPLVASGVAVAIAIVQSLSSTSAQTQNRARYLPEYTASGDLILPKDFHEWVLRWIAAHSQRA